MVSFSAKLMFAFRFTSCFSKANGIALMPLIYTEICNRCFSSPLFVAVTAP